MSEVSGVILKAVDYRDNDSILTVYTKDRGKVQFYARGVKKINSKNARVLLPYTEVLIGFDEKYHRAIHSIQNASTLHLYRHCHENLRASAAADVLCTAVDLFSEEDDVDEERYMELIQGLELLEEKADANTVMGLFLSDLMKAEGISPEVDHCVSCGKPSAVTISIDDGGFLCGDCARQKNLSVMDIAVLKHFRLLIKADLDKYEIVENAGKVSGQELDLIYRFIQYHAGVDLKPLYFYLSLYAG